MNSIGQENKDMTYSILTNQESVNNDQKNQTPKFPQMSLAFTMMAAAMGTGIFNLPLRIAEIGILTFVIYITLGAYFSYSGAILISNLYKKFDFSSYGQMSETAFGKGLKVISEICLIIFPWGIVICFQVILVKFILQLGADVCGFDFYENRDQQIYNTKGNTTRILLNIGVISTAFFFIVKKQLGIIQNLTKVGITIVGYNTLTVFLTMLFGFTRNVQPQLQYHGLFHLDWSKVAWVTFTGWESVSQHVQALSSILFCYINHQLVFYVSKNIQNPTPQRLTQTFKIVNISECVAYIFIGISGYLLLVEHEDVEPIGAMVITNITTIPMSIGKFLMVFSLYICIPLNMFPSRQIFYEGFKIKNTNKNRIILSAILSGLSCLIAIAFQHVNSYFGLLGGTAGVMMGGGIPILCYIKFVIIKEKVENIQVIKSGNDKVTQAQQVENLPEQQQNIQIGWQILRIIIFVIVILMGVSGAILSVVDPA